MTNRIKSHKTPLPARGGPRDATTYNVLRFGRDLTDRKAIFGMFLTPYVAILPHP